MTTIVVLFNLKSGVDKAAYETWAQTTDMPTVRSLSSIANFSVHRSAGLLGSETLPPYQYIELIKVADMAQFGADVATETMQRVAAEFQNFADNPLFIMTEDVGA
jgi:REDY-like protein HapK